MLKRLNVEWEAVDRTIQTKGGQYLATAKNDEIALLMSRMPKIMKFVLALHEGDDEIKNQINSILNSED